MGSKLQKLTFSMMLLASLICSYLSSFTLGYGLALFVYSLTILYWLYSVLVFIFVIKKKYLNQLITIALWLNWVTVLFVSINPFALYLATVFDLNVGERFFLLLFGFSLLAAIICEAISFLLFLIGILSKIKK